MYESGSRSVCGLESLLELMSEYELGSPLACWSVCALVFRLGCELVSQ